jgi:excisionase family DNA binding protein
MTRILRIDQAADWLQIHPRTLRRWIASGHIQAARISRIWMITEDEVQRILSSYVPLSPLKSQKMRGAIDK